MQSMIHTTGFHLGIIIIIFTPLTHHKQYEYEYSVHVFWSVQ
jgi:hypothetical protein